MFITLTFKKKAEAVVEFGNQLLKNLPPNVKVREIFWKLGEYDSVILAPAERHIVEALFDKAGTFRVLNTTYTLVFLSADDEFCFVFCLNHTIDPQFDRVSTTERNLCHCILTSLNASCNSLFCSIVSFVMNKVTQLYPFKSFWFFCGVS